MSFAGRDAIIDVEEVLQYIEQLEADFEVQLAVAAGNAPEELISLKALVAEIRGNGGDYQYEGDWYPSTLINEDRHFNDAMDGLMEDCGYIPQNLPPFLSIKIDYDALKQDYTSVDFDGETFLYR